MDINKYISEMREKKGVTQSEMGAALGVSEKVISKWECGETKPNIELLPSIADYFEVSIDEMFGHKHNLKQDIRDFAYEHMLPLHQCETGKEIYEVVSNMIRGSAVADLRNSYPPSEDLDKTIASIENDKGKGNSSFPTGDYYVHKNEFNDTKLLIVQSLKEDSLIKLLDAHDKYIKTFEMLSKKESYPLLKFFYLVEPRKGYYTAEYISEQTGVDADTVADFIEEHIWWNFTSTAIVEGKEIKIYQFLSNDKVIKAIIHTAYLTKHSLEDIDNVC